MTKRKIYFRADASATIGYGHFIRTLALADMLRDDFNCTFFTSSPSAYQIKEMEKVCSYVGLNDESKFEDFINLLTGDEIVVLDNYFFTTEYQIQIKDKGCKLVCVDDMHNKHYVADIVINHGVYDSSLFSIESYTKLCLGLNWALLRKPFICNNNRIKEKGHWLITFGGCDQFNLTEKFIKLLHYKVEVKNITVVVGDSYKHINSILPYTKVNILKNISAEEMASVMSMAEFAIVPSSSVCIEAISQDCKVYTGWYVDNQLDFFNYVVGSRYALGLGNLLSNEFVQFNHNIETLNKFNKFDKIQSNFINLFKNDLLGE